MYKQRLKEYIEEDQIYQDYKEQKEFESSDFDNFCILHCEDIEEALFDLEQLSKINKELHNKIDKAIEFINNNGEKQYNHYDNYRGKWYSPDELDTILEILEKDSDVDE